MIAPKGGYLSYFLSDLIPPTPFKKGESERVA